MLLPSPLQLGLPHIAWRKNQKTAIENAYSMYDNGGGNYIIEQPCGSGKSAIASALGSKDKVLALVQSLGLLEQYEREYGFVIIKGKREYPCILKQKVKAWETGYGVKPTAGDCHFGRMTNCPVSSSCPYIKQRERAFSARKMACTYKYAVLSGDVSDRTGIIVLDEMHSIPQEILGVVDIKYTSDDITDFGLPNFPFTSFGQGNLGDILNQNETLTIIAWINYCVAKLDKMYDTINPMSKRNSAVSNIKQRLESGITVLENSETIFLQIEDVKNGFVRKRVISIKPIDVKSIIKNVLKAKKLRLFMSATIGNVKPIANEIGLDKYIFESFDHPIPINKRPVANLCVGKMSWSNLSRNTELYNAQAIGISSYIKKLPKEYRGIILTTSNQKIKILEEKLTRLLKDRKIISKQEGVGLADRINCFIDDKTDGLIAIDTIQGWGHGLNLSGNKARFVVIAGVPFANPNDRFEKIRMDRPGGKDYYYYEAYSSIPQAAGRVTRGEKDDDGEYISNYAAIADGLAVTHQALSSYPKYFREAII